ncbi:hypothetical protein BGZ60DRAFT_534447 [Tricladium varicosporioides]|nr:hypothetical protein BGZ60DRAFT_534447 [Hymenoscyphus varicosporioides]
MSLNISLSVRQTDSRLNQQNEIWKDCIAKSRDMSDLSQKSYSSNQRRRNDPIQEQDLTTRNSPNSDDNDNLADIDELLSGMWQKNNSANTDPNNDDDNNSFVDRDDFLSDIQQENMPASANLNSSNIVKKEAVKMSTLRFSIWPGLLTHTMPDPIILSDNEHVGAESETDYNDLDVDLGAKSDSDSSHVAGSELADNNGFGSETPHISDRPGSASSGHGPITHQASKLRVNTNITQGTTSYDNLDATKELEGKGFDIFAEEDGNSDNNTHSTKRRTLSAVSNKNPASDSNISRLQDSRPDDTQSPQLGLATVSPHQSDLKNDHLSKQRRRGAQSRTLITAPNQEQELRDISLEIVDNKNTDNSDNRDYTNESDAAGSKIGGRPRPRKRARRTKNTEDNNITAPFTHSLGTLYQTITVTSSSDILKSEEIPIHGYFTLKSIESKVVYCLTFSQELLPRPQDRGQRQGTITNLGEPQSVALVADPNH